MISVDNKFHEAARGQIITPVVSPYISFTKELDPSVGIFTLDQSVLDGPDILALREPNVLQIWDLYKYLDFSDRLVKVSLSRSIEFPYTVQIGQADITFDNHDGYFTPGSGSAIDENNLPGRPVRIYAGFQGQGSIPQLVGLTEDTPDINQASRTADYHINDFLTSICESSLTEVVDMRDVRTDEVLAAIVEQFGLSPSQYNFEEGANVIPFVFFDIGDSAGDVIKKLVHAENGRFWLDELGILRFQAWASFNDELAMTFDEYSILEVRPADNSQMINHVKIQAEIREVQEYQYVYTKSSSGDRTSNLWVIDPNFSNEISCSLEDPCYDVQNPTLGRSSSVSWFTAKDANGNEITSGITATSRLTSNALIITFTNTNNFSVEIDEMRLYGEPAKVTNFLDYEAYDEESVEEYGERPLEITNNEFFQSENQADLFARYMLYERARYNPILNVEVKGDFSLMLGDIIELQGEYAGTYIVDGINWEHGPGYLFTTLTVHQYNAPHYFTLDSSELDGTDVLR